MRQSVTLPRQRVSPPACHFGCCRLGEASYFCGILRVLCLQHQSARQMQSQYGRESQRRHLVAERHNPRVSPGTSMSYTPRCVTTFRRSQTPRSSADGQPTAFGETGFTSSSCHWTTPVSFAMGEVSARLDCVRILNRQTDEQGREGEINISNSGERAVQRRKASPKGTQEL